MAHPRAHPGAHNGAHSFGIHGDTLQKHICEMVSTVSIENLEASEKPILGHTQGLTRGHTKDLGRAIAHTLGHNDQSRISKARSAHRGSLGQDLFLNSWRIPSNTTVSCNSESLLAEGRGGEGAYGCSASDMMCLEWCVLTVVHMVVHRSRHSKIMFLL